MPQKWLADLWLSKPATAEAIQYLCCEYVRKSTHQTYNHVARVVDGEKTDKKTLALFWECIDRRKINREGRKKKS